MSPAGNAFRLGEKIGSGAFGHVFRAQEMPTGRVVALKKSRVSLKVQRTIIYHEARILRLLAGHPSIPAVFSYGRFEHFEYLAMELLDCTLGDIVRAQGRLPLQSVLRVAEQMLSVLEHIHGHRIVHRDIKPNNIMVHDKDISIVYLIDFGIARPNVVGTLAWASLNAHCGIDLGPRDDLESLAYALLFLLRGELPWENHCDHGTVLGRIAQIREKKRTWTGSRLAEGYPPLFGQLLDYARGLRFHETIDYNRFRAQLESFRQNSDTKMSTAREIPKPSCINRFEPHEYSVEAGQLVHVQIVAHTSIEGYSMQAGDRSHWNDPALSSDDWRTSSRPAVVINTAFDNILSLQKIQVVSLGHGTPVKGTPIIRVVPPSLQGDQVETVVPDPPWPMPETYCYAFPRATWFYCLPSQKHLPVHWMIRPEGINLLRETFATPPPRVHWGDTENDPDPDVRYDTRMKGQSVKFFANVSPLTPSHVEQTRYTDDLVDWGGNRAWFDERVRIARRRGRDDGLRNWTVSGEDVFEDEEPRISNSYFASDHSLWQNLQQERDRSLTLDLGQQEKASGHAKLESIVNIV